MRRLKNIFIEKIIYGGDGIGRLPDGKVVFVSQVLPEEKVVIDILPTNRRDFVRGRLIDITSSSPFRIKPSCSYAKECGGCQWQHITYNFQTRLKEDIVKETIERIGRLSSHIVEPLRPSPQQNYYRHRLQFQVISDTGELGFFKKNSHKIVRLNSCVIAVHKINSFLQKIEKSPIFKNIVRHASVKRMEVSYSEADDLIALLLWCKNRPSAKQLQKLKESISILKAIFIWIKGRFPEGPYPDNISDNGKLVFRLPIISNNIIRELKASPGIFTQVNWKQNLFMIEKVIELSGDLSNKRVLDLHCGMGNFLLPLSMLAKKGYGVDSDLRAIMDAENNIKDWRLENCEVERNIAIKAIKKLIKDKQCYDVIILDPPRSGCKELIKYIPKLKPQKVIYISCDVATLSRDLSLFQKIGFTPKKVLPIDMFPQTYHIETITLIE